MTFGSSRVTFIGGRIASRRIDLCGEDHDRGRSALPHEMSHVILADHFGRRGPPRWAEEGISLLADGAKKQARHQDDLNDAMKSGTTFSFGHLAAVESQPAANQLPVFYAQSASLTRYLVGLKSPREFVVFLEAAQRRGYDDAAHDVYGLAGMREMERAWLADVSRQTRALTNLARESLPVATSKDKIAIHLR
jgi:hypothetical protein